MNESAQAIIDPGWMRIAFAFGMIVATVILSRIMGLALEKDITIAAVRCFIQLVAIGYLLKYIFSLHRWYFVLAFICAMILVATRAAVKRQKRKVAGIYPITGLSLVISAGINIVLITFVIVGHTPWYEPRYLIPLAGIIIGNTMNGAALAADRFASELKNRKDEVEAYLALGATTRKATAGPVSETLRTALMNV
ncbi:ABC transporter permease, partial [Acidobacteriota bacterium]